MNKSNLILITILTCSLAAGSAYADRDRGVAGFLKAVAEASQAARQHRDRGYQDQGYAQHASRYEEADYYEQVSVSVDLRGDWVMNGGNVNRFQKTHQGYYVMPVGRGKGVHYVEIGDNLYQEANGAATYEAIDDNYMIWSSGDRRGAEVELYRR